LRPAAGATFNHYVLTVVADAKPSRPARRSPAPRPLVLALAAFALAWTNAAARADTFTAARDGLARAGETARRMREIPLASAGDVRWIPESVVQDAMGADAARADAIPEWATFVRLEADGRRRWLRVDTAAPDGAVTDLFDHDAVAALLSQGGARVDPDRLPIARLEFDVDDAAAADDDDSTWPVVLLSIEGHARTLAAPLALPGRTDAPPPVEDADATQVRSLEEPLRPGTARSRGGSVSTGITFVNRLDRPVRLFWVDPGGDERAYATLEPGATHAQHTFAGHAWIARDLDGNALGHTVGRRTPRTVIIDGAPREAPGRDEAARAPRPRQARDAAQASPSARSTTNTIAIDGGNVVIRDAAGATRHATTDGVDGDAYVGPVHVSPDGTLALAFKVQTVPTRTITLVESSPNDQVQPKLRTIPYAKPGDPIDRPVPHLFDVAAAREIPIDTSLVPNPWSIDHVRWAGDSSRVTFLYNERGHQRLRVVALDAAGTMRAVVDEQSPTFLDYAGKLFLEFLSDDELLWTSERDGWNHLYLVDVRSGTREGAVARQLTRGEWVVRRVRSVDREARTATLEVGGIHPDQDPYHVHVIRVPLDGGEPVILTQGDGTHRVEFAPSGRHYIDTYSRVDLAPVTELRRTGDGSLVTTLARASAEPLLAAGWRMPERFVAKGRDGVTDIWGVLWRPTSFDPSRRYPVIENIYAGPQDSFVPKSFDAWHGQRDLAELGYIVVQIDGMGTSNRSKAFHDVCAKNLKDAGFPDRVRWLEAAAKAHPEMDLARVGIYGGSAGGQNAMRGLLDWPRTYKVGVADCGCHDNRMDKIWWNELWMGWPVDESYARSSNVVDAAKLEGKLLLIVGEVDSNVDPSSTLQVAHALMEAGKDFDLLVLPGVGHGAAESPFGRIKRAEFFLRHLPVP
jgi:dipeptidyl-peptidase-4